MPVGITVVVLYIKQSSFFHISSQRQILSGKTILSARRTHIPRGTRTHDYIDYIYYTSFYPKLKRDSVAFLTEELRVYFNVYLYLFVCLIICVFICFVDIPLATKTSMTHLISVVCL